MIPGDKLALLLRKLFHSLCPLSYLIRPCSLRVIAFYLGSSLAVLRSYSSPCTQRSVLAMLRRSNVLGIEFRSTARGKSCWPISPVPLHDSLLTFGSVPVQVVKELDIKR